MRKILLIGTVLVLPMNAMAQTAAETARRAAETSGPRGRPTIDGGREGGRDGTVASRRACRRPVRRDDHGYRVAAIAAGAVAGVIVASVVTGGTITPVLLAGAGEAESATLVAEGSGVLIGGYIGNRVYGD